MCSSMSKSVVKVKFLHQEWKEFQMNKNLNPNPSESMRRPVGQKSNYMNFTLILLLIN